MGKERPLLLGRGPGQLCNESLQLSLHLWLRVPGRLTSSRHHSPHCESSQVQLLVGNYIRYKRKEMQNHCQKFPLQYNLSLQWNACNSNGQWNTVIVIACCAMLEYMYMPSSSTGPTGFSSGMLHLYHTVYMYM